MLLAGALLFGGVIDAQAGSGNISLEYVNHWIVEGEPALIAVDAVSGDVYVNINNNWRIFHYTAQGEFIGFFGREGETPAGLAVDAEGFVIVAVNINQNHHVVRYDRFGGVTAEWDGEGEVGGLAADAEGRSVVAVNINQSYRVVRYGQGAEYYPCHIEECIEKLGTIVAITADPAGGPLVAVAVAIAADPAGGAVVAVNINNNYYVFRYGVGYELLTGWEVVAGVIETNGIAVGPNGTVFVNINNSHRTVAYSASGEYIGEFGSEGTGPGQFLYPTGIAITGGLLYVADSGNHRIQVFALEMR
jgi:hypothetical protein